MSNGKRAFGGLCGLVLLAHGARPSCADVVPERALRDAGASGAKGREGRPAFDRLCQAPGRTLITGVGMHMAKHVAAVWSSEDGPGGTPPATEALQAEVDAAQPRRTVLTGYSGPATVCAYTVAHGRDGSPHRGLVVLDTEAGRALARVHEADLLVDAESRELVGQAVTVTSDGKHNEARW